MQIDYPRYFRFQVERCSDVHLYCVNWNGLLFCQACSVNEGEEDIHDCNTTSGKSPSVAIDIVFA